MHIIQTDVWDTAYGHAVLKLERANHHIDEFRQRIFESPDRNGTSLHMDGKTGEQFLYYAQGDYMLRGELATITGDAIHNLRSALDIAWLEIVRGNGIEPGNDAKFPIRPDQPKQWLEGVLPKNAGVQPGTDMFDFLVNHVKGYKGGDSDILSIHALDIDDKHRLLIPMVKVTGIAGIELEYDDGEIHVFDTVLLTHREFFRRVVPFGSKLKNHGEVQFHIAFGEGDLAGVEILPTLSKWHDKVWELLRWLQRIK